MAIDFGDVADALSGLIWMTRDDGRNDFVNRGACQADGHDLKHAEDLLAAEVKLLAMVARGEPLSQVLGALGRHLEALCDSCFCHVLLVTSDGRRFHLGVDSSAPEAGDDILVGQIIDGDHDPCSLSVIAKTPVTTTDLADDPRWRRSDWPKLLTQQGYASCSAIPIISSCGETSGVIAIYRREHVVSTLQEQALVDRFAKIAGIAIDRAQTDAALRTSEADLRRTNAQLIDAHRLSKTGSFIWDVLTDDHTWTEEIFRLFEFDPTTKVDTPMMLQAIHPEDLPAVKSLLAGALEGADFETGFRVVTPSGQVKHARAVGRRIGGDADRPVFMGAVQDVTASKVAEESLNRARSELAHVARVATLNAMTASITHEVSQPLSGILTNASTCLRMLATDPPDLRGAADTARRTIRDADRATEVVKRLRALFGKTTPTIETVEINEAAREVIAISSTELRMNRVVVETRFTEGLPAIRGDRVQLQQVILNLLLNAADAMATIEDRLRTLVVSTEADGPYAVRVLVRDVGVGLDPRTSAKLFQAFYTTKAHGMGIGLSISRSIIESHAGRLWASANDGPGATFGFSVPCTSAGAAPAK